MTDFIEVFNTLLPQFEDAVYQQRTEEERRAYAQGINCIPATLRARSFFRTIGLSAVREEIHYGLIYGHSFMSAPAGDTNELCLDDTIIDPTYLQYAKKGTDISALPNVFIGTRADMIGLMNSPGYVRKPKFIRLYEKGTGKIVHRTSSS